MQGKVHRVIREEQVGPSTTFTFDIETQSVVNLLITWGNDDTSGAAPTGLILCPTNCKRANLVFASFAPLPSPPLPGYNAFVGIGPNCSLAMPLPDMITVGVINPAGVTVSIRVSGDVIGDYRSRS